MLWLGFQLKSLSSLRKKFMAYTNPQISDFQTFFVRSFPFGNSNSDPNTSVLPVDITNAFQMTNININQALFACQSDYTTGYLLLAAHYLVTNLRNSSQGINGQYNWLEQSKGVGSINSSYAIPQRILDNPYWSQLTKSNFGAEYLNIILPQLAGAMTISYGRTLP